MKVILSGGPRKYAGFRGTFDKTLVVIDMGVHAKGRWCRTPFTNGDGSVIFAYVKAVDFK